MAYQLKADVIAEKQKEVAIPPNVRRMRQTMKHQLERNHDPGQAEPDDDTGYPNRARST